MIGGIGFQNILDAFERFGKRFGVIVLADVQDQRFGLPDLLGQFLLRAQRDQLAVIDDADAVGEFLRLLPCNGWCRARSCPAC